MRTSLFRIFILLCLTPLAELKAQIDTTMKTVIINHKEWASENLNVVTYQNGDTIPEVKDPKVWATLTTGAWCYYDNKKENGAKYGKLYNWYALTDQRGLAPKGFHIPSHKEFQELIEGLGGDDLAVEKLMSKSGWVKDEYGNGAMGTNETGFTLIPSGIRSPGEPFEFLANEAYLGTGTPSSIKPETSLVRVFYSEGSTIIGYLVKQTGISVRCIKD